MYTDTHCHILSEYYKDIPLLINKSVDSGIHQFINAAYNSSSIIEVVNLCEKYSMVYGAIGIHPSEASLYDENDLKLLLQYIHATRIIAIGEIGLDYHYGKEDKYKQIQLFSSQLAIALEYNIPVIIHSREATEDTINILKKYNVKGIIHSFSGSIETANEYIKMGFLLGINGVITFKNSKLLETFKQLPLSSIVFETDSPYLTPEPFRGLPNNPTYINNIIDYISNNTNYSKEELSRQSESNIHRIFDI